MPLSDISGSVDDILVKAKNRLNIVKGELRPQSFLSFVDIENISSSTDRTETTEQASVKVTSVESGESEEIDIKISCGSPDMTDGPLSDALRDKNATLLDDKSQSERKGPEKNLTQKMLADQLINENKIQWVPKMNAYMVEGIKNSKRVVTLAPKETCSCPASGQCFNRISILRF